MFFAALVFLAGSSYGVMGTAVKTTEAAGFTWQEIAFSQTFFGALLFGACWVAQAMRGGTLARVAPGQAGRLVALGANGCLTTLLYTYALTVMPVALAVTLLFQFAWMGLVLQLVLERRGPRAAEAAAAALVVAGTLCSCGLIGGAYDFAQVSVLGVACALGSAVSYTSFVHFSGKVAPDLPWMQRGLFVTLGGMLLAAPFCPGYFTGGALLHGLAGHGLVLGLFSQFIPVALLGLGCPHVSTGVATVMAASELPVGILVSLAVLGEPVSGLQAAGIVLVLAGIVLASGVLHPPRAA